MPRWNDLDDHARWFALNAGTLSAQQKQILQLTATMTDTEIAELLGLTRSTVRSQHERALIKLYKEMAA